MSTINFPIMYINNPAQGKPIFNGKMYFGQPDLDPEIPINQKQVYYIQENGDLVAASQPITLSAGGNPTYNGDAVTLSITGEYSTKVLNKLGVQEYYIARTDSSGDSGSVITYAENEQTLIAGQLVVDFTGITVAVANIFIGKNSGDRGKLFVGDDYEITGGSQITLTSSFGAGTKLIAASSELVVRDTLSQAYEFETVSDMTSSVTVFPIGKALRVIDINANYKVTAGASPNIGSPALTAGLYAALPLDNGKVYPKKWGLFTDNTNATTNDAILEAIKDYVVSFPQGSRPSIHLPNGQIAYTVSPNWGYHGMVVKGDGADFCQFKYTGIGRAFNIDPSEFDLQFIFGCNFEGFLVDLGPDGTDGVYMENVAHSLFKNIFTTNGALAAIHWHIALAVLCDFNTCGTPIDRYAVTGIHSETFRLAASPSKGLPTTACTFTNIIAEGASVAGIRLIDADVCVFDGGTSESNTGRGVIVSASCRSNIFNAMDMEANTGQDFNDAGQGTEWNNCLATSVLGSELSGSAIMSKVNGGYYDLLVVEAGSKSSIVENVSVNVKGTGGFADAGTDTTKVKIYDKTADSFINTVKGSRTLITLTASPFTYKNETNQAQQVLVRGGTIDTVFWKRDTDTVEMGGVAEGGNVNNQFWLSPDDELVVTYTAAPVMNFIPMGIQNL